MTGLAQIFAELGISQYLDEFIDQGFDTWETILDITESDFDALQVKLGHRRKIQRRIADSRGISTERALSSPTPHIDERIFGEEQRSLRSKGDGKDQLGLNTGVKRKYRRHPKQDENAPERPPSAYVIFSNKIREDLKHQQLSFTEIAKRVGENWQNLPPSEKEPYESQASAAKDIYNNALAEYKKTENFKTYQAYLADFKAKQSSAQQAAAEAESAKRPKLENRTSNESSGNGSSTATSQTGDNTPLIRKRACSGASASSMQWVVSQNVAAQAASSSGSAQYGGPSGVAVHASPTIPPSGILPGFRDTLMSPVPLREAPPRETDSGPYRQQASLANSFHPSRNRPNEQHGSPFESLTRQTPLLTHDTTVDSASSGSSSVGALPTPRTPLDIGRGTPQLPNLFPSKMSGFFDGNQLPPLRPPSLSPQSSVNNSYHSPQGDSLSADRANLKGTVNRVLTTGGLVPPMDYPGPTQAQSSLRNYAQHMPSSQPSSTMHISNVTEPAAMRQYGSATYTSDDGDLDPVSALIKAGEIVNRNAMNSRKS